MNTDIRISVSFRGHRKRKRLRAVLGEDGTGYLLDLWISAALDRPDGILTGLDEIDIALMAGWDGDPGKLVDALISVGFLDRGDDGVYALHDWTVHNGYASAANVRSEKSRKAAHARWGVPGDEDAPAGDAGDDAQALPEQCAGNAVAMCQPSAIVTLYNDTLGVPPYSLPRIKVLSVRLRTALSARIKEDKARFDLEWWRNFFLNEVAPSDFLCGRSERGFRADLHWLAGAENMAKVINGRYVNTNRTPPQNGGRAPSATRAGLDALKGGGNGTGKGLGGRNGAGHAPDAGAIELKADTDGGYSA